MSDPSQPRTRRVALAWEEPSARAFDHQSVIVETLAASRAVDAFNMSADALTMLVDDFREVRVSARGMSIWSLAPSSLEEDVAAFVDVAEATVHVLRVRPVDCRTSLQHIVPWPDDADFGSACQEATRRVLGPLADEIGASDFALLLDGARGRGGTFQCEFGVINAEEAAARLSRLIGKMMTDAVPRRMDSIWDATYPDVATFVDSSWASAPTDTAVAVRDLLVREIEATDKEAVQLTERLHKQVSGLGI